MTLTTGLAPVAAVTDPTALGDVFIPTRTARRRAGWIVLALDVLVGGAAALATAALSPGVGLPLFFVVLLAGWPVAVLATGGYARIAEDPYAIHVRGLLAAGATLAAAAWVTLTVAPHVADGPTPRAMAAMTLIFAGTVALGSIGARFLLPLVSPRLPLTVVLAGPEREVRELLKEADRKGRRREFVPVAVCVPVPTEEPAPDAPRWSVDVWHGVEESQLEAVHTHAAEAVVVVPGAGTTHHELRRWATWLQDDEVQLLVSPGLRDVSAGRLGTATMGGARLVRVRPARLRGAGQLVKSLVDRAAALLLLVLLLPVLALVTVLIRVDSPGPAWFRQTRVGRNGRPFTVHKFRTMVVGSHEARDELADANESDRDGVLFKMKRDPRVTRVGAVLRKYSLDELPQLVNVLLGEMSLVGPRPALPKEVQEYSPDLRRRLVVRPGMTGLWQVSGRSDLSWEETVRMDLQYVDNWSWSLDLSIAARTVGAVLGQKGAY